MTDPNTKTSQDEPSVDSADTTGSHSMNDAPLEASIKRSIFARIMSMTGVALAAGAIVAVAAGGITALQLRAGAEAALEPHPPVQVTTQPIILQASYETTARYVGRLEAARETQISFERAGLIEQIHVDEGGAVKAGAVIARLDTRPLEIQRRQIVSQRKELEARRDLAQATLGRQSNLNTKGWSPEQRLDEARFSVVELTAGLERLAAQIDAIDLDIAKSEVHAPFDGVVAARFVDEGAVVAAGTPVVTVIEAGKPRVRVGVSVGTAAKLNTDRPYTFAANGSQFKGRLFRTRADLSPQTRTVITLFDIEGTAPVPFGETVVLEVTDRVHQAGAWVPLSALSEGRKGLWSIYVVVKEGGSPIVRRAAVALLHTEAERAFVRTSVTDGTLIVNGGTNRVISGQRVALRPAE